MTRHICDGHEYRVIEESRRRLVAKNNYGTEVAVAVLSPCEEYWHFGEIGGEHHNDQFHENTLAGRPIAERLVQWYAAVAA